MSQVSFHSILMHGTMRETAFHEVPVKSRPLKSRTEPRLTICNHLTPQASGIRHENILREKTVLSVTLSREDTEYCILVYPCQVMFICRNKLMLILWAPLNYKCIRKVSVWKDKWMNEWQNTRTVHKTDICNRIPNLWLQTILNQMSLRASPGLTFNTCLVWFCASWCEVHGNLVTLKSTQAKSFYKPLFCP